MNHSKSLFMNQVDYFYREYVLPAIFITILVVYVFGLGYMFCYVTADFTMSNEQAIALCQ